jgi:hypothetical protein
MPPPLPPWLPSSSNSSRGSDATVFSRSFLPPPPPPSVVFYEKRAAHPPNVMMIDLPGLQEDAILLRMDSIASP